jgi:hypothetical protein
MAFGRKNVSVAGADRGADVVGLARFFRDDDLIGNAGLGWNNRVGLEHIVNTIIAQAAF